MFIQIAETPNPQTLKFLPLPDYVVSPDGMFNFKKDQEECKNVPVLNNLFSIEGISGVFFGEDFVGITKLADYEWDNIKAFVIDILLNYCVTGSPLITEQMVNGNVSNSTEIKEDDDEIVKQIKEIIENKIRPSVAMDGGDVVYINFEDGIVYVEMIGACSECPSSTITLKNGIENMLKHYVPEVIAVEQVTR